MIRYRIKIKKRERTMETDATYRGTVYPWSAITSGT
jgi:hypothetical protein